MEGELVLEVGCGSGRFTTHAADIGATIVSCDLSSAVEASYRTNGYRDNVLIVQADIFGMPFERGSFDRAFCFGVLQHTPDPRRAFMGLIPFLRSGGHLATDIYLKSLVHWVLQTKYYVRPLVRHLSPEKLYSWTKKYVDAMWPLCRLIRKIPRTGYALNWRLLVADYSSTLLDAPDDVLREWAYLDTFDMLSPLYDQPQTLKTFKRWHIDAGLGQTELHYGYNGIEGRGIKP
jgi:SAM-dependent methyltransferase